MDTNKAQFDSEKRAKRLAYNLKKKHDKEWKQILEQKWVHKLNKEKE